MKNLKLMSVMKHLSVAALGAVLALGVVVMPKMTVKADTNTYALHLNSSTQYDGDGYFVLPQDIGKNDVTEIIADTGYIIPADSTYLFSGYLNVKSIDISKADISNVNTMRGWFCDDKSLETLNLGTSWDTSNVTDMSYMFCGCEKLTTLNDNVKCFTSTSNVQEMAEMFENCKAVTVLDLSKFDISNIKNNNTSKNTEYWKMDMMFAGCSNLEKIIVNSQWHINDNIDATNMFLDDLNLVGGNGTKYNSSNDHRTYARIDLGGYNISEPAGYLTDVDNIDLYGKVTTKEGMLNFEIRFLPRSGKSYTVFLNNGVITDKTYISDDGYRCYVIHSPAKNMVDTYKFTIVEDGVILCNREVSIASYLTKLYNTTDGSTSEGLKIKNMSGVLLRYGAAAQQRIGYKADSADTLANAGVPDYQNQDNPAICSFGTDITEHCELTPSNEFKTMLTGYNLQYYGINVSMDDNLTFMMAFRLINDSTASDWTDAKKTAFRNDMSEYYNDTYETQLPPINDFKIDDSGKFLIIYTRNVGIKYANKTLYKASALGENVSIPVYLYRNVKYKPDYASVSRCLYSLILTASNY